MNGLAKTLGGLPPFSWLLDLTVHFPWIWVMAVFLIPTTLSLLWKSVVLVRADSASYDPDKATYLPSGRPRKRPINLDKARLRRYSWLSLAVPLGIVAYGMFTIQLLSFHTGTYVVIAFAYFFTTPLRNVFGMANARRAFRKSNPGEKLESSLWDDIIAYYESGVSRPASRKRAEEEYEPRFYPKNGFYKFLNWGHKQLLKLRPLRLLARFLRVFALWGILVQFAVCWFWPLAACIVPFWYLHEAEDYQNWAKPWWRISRKSSNHPGYNVVKGEVIKDGPETAGSPTSAVARRPGR